MKDEYIKPCPFCGSEHTFVFVGFLHYHVQCDFCGAHGGKSWRKYIAIEKWNRRF